VTLNAVNSARLNSLQKAVYDNDVKKVIKLISERDRDVNKLDTYHQCTALHIAAEHNRLDIARILLDPTNSLQGNWGSLEKKYGDVTMLNLEGRTPFLLVRITRLITIGMQGGKC
jgi:ankyrin repeat protein